MKNKILGRFMLYSVIICIAYIIGILWGLYSELYLSIVSFFLFICASILGIYITKIRNEKILYSEKQTIDIYNQNFDKNKKCIEKELNMKKLSKILLLITFSFLFGFANSYYRLYDFKSKYSSRNLL